MVMEKFTLPPYKSSCTCMCDDLYHSRHGVLYVMYMCISSQELLASRPHNDSGSTPMHIVGAFLAALFSNFELSSYSLKKRRTSSAVTQSMTAQCTKVLYSCPGFTQSQLLRLIIQTYGGAPEVFEVFHCRPTTTEEELQLFLNYKRATKRPFQYLILEVNKLSYPLQEVSTGAGSLGAVLVHSSMIITCTCTYMYIRSCPAGGEHWCRQFRCRVSAQLDDHYLYMYVHVYT